MNPRPAWTRRRAAPVGDHPRLQPPGKTIVSPATTWTEADSLCQSLAIIDPRPHSSPRGPRRSQIVIPGGYLLRLRFDSAPEALLVDCAHRRRARGSIRPTSCRGRLFQPRRIAHPCDRRRVPGRGRGKSAIFTSKNRASKPCSSYTGRSLHD